jgi:ribonucleoside-diphosphate reductase alpha chain
MEKISFYAIQSSCLLAKERGAYDTFKGSKWDRGIFPLDTISLLETERGQTIEIDKTSTMQWDELKEKVAEFGIRNSNIMAIAPTATIANIAGIYPCTEPAFKNMYMKENLSGNFVVMNRFLINDLDKLSLWNDRMIQKIKLNNGSIATIEEIPNTIKSKYKETFEIDMKWIVAAASRRSKWVDQSMSTNIFMITKSGKALSDVYIDAWRQGLKTTYYLRTQGASQVTKATVSEAAQADPDTPKQPVTSAATAAAKQAQSQPNLAKNAAVQTTSPAPSDPPQQSTFMYSHMDADCEACQ